MNETRIGDTADNLMTLFFRERVPSQAEGPVMEVGYKQYD